jgi:hypothetical protein
LLALFTAIFSALGAIPAFESIMNTAIQAWTNYQKAKEEASIDTATKESSAAVTSSDVEKAAEDAASATRSL